MKMDLENEIVNLRIKVQELLYAQVLHDCTSCSKWLIKKDFTLTQGAANYSFIYILFKILDETMPKNILEFGLGQTTKLTTQYANFYSDVNLDVVEHNKKWIELFAKKLKITPNIKIAHKELINFALNGIKSDKYDSLKDITGDKKYDLIVIDGPIGIDRIYPRTNVLDLIPENLAESFVILLDDAERPGEQNTAKLIFDKLSSYSIEYRMTYQTGTKHQLVISSHDNECIHWI